MTAGPAINPTDIIARLQKNIESVVMGKTDSIRLCMVALIAGEHILLEDVPGVGKTLIGKSLAKSIDADFCRLQFTPDLLPTDIVGSSIFKPKTSEFEFIKGPIFSNVVLADEINRAPPRTQSALLEAMSEKQVSVDGHSYPLADPFIVIATQNPYEFEGTYNLPESQMDRFLLRISVGYPNPERELEILSSHRNGEPVNQLGPVVNNSDICALHVAARNVHVDDSISKYILDVVHRTRNSDELRVGVSTRGALLWYKAAQSLALMEGKDFVTPDHAKQLAVSVLSHRVSPRRLLSGAQKHEIEAIMERLVDEVDVPS
jgi:MoxR-like ATPase